MRPTDPLSRMIFDLIPFAVVIGLCWAAIWLLRRTGLSKPAANAQALSPWTWRLIGSAFVSFVVAKTLDRNPPHLTGLASVGVFLAVFGLLVSATLLNRWLSRDRAFRRAVKRANAGDVAGAITVLQAALDRRPDRPTLPPPPGPSPDPADPWAPPRMAIGRDVRAANRFNLMGRLVGTRGDWAEALAWFRRAEGAVGPEPVFRLNVGLARAKLGDETEGFAAMRAALAAAPPNLPLHRFEFALVLARTLAEAGHPDEARARLDDAAEALRAAKVYPWSARTRLEAAVATVRALLPLPDPADRDPLPDHA